MSEWSDSEVAQRVKRELDRTRNRSPSFVATKFDREYAVCDHDSGMFNIPFPPVAKHADEEMLRAMRDALQKAWIVLDSLRTYRTEDELLEIIGSEQFADAREAVRQAGALQVGGQK